MSHPENTLRMIIEEINKVIFQLTSNQMKLIALLAEKGVLTQAEVDKLLGNKDGT